MKKIYLTFLLAMIYASTYAQWITSGSNIYYSSGNVGIGTTNPTSPLTVNGNIQSANLNSTGSDTFFGAALANVSVTGSGNTIFGNASVNALTSGSWNTVIGYRTAEALTTGNRNIIIGTYNTSNNTYTAQAMTTGSDNIIIGTSAGSALTTGTQNVGLGNGSLSGATGSYNTAIGALAGYAGSGGTGSNNVYLGWAAGESNSSGGNNVYVGYQSGLANSTGSNLTFLGYGAGNSGTSNGLSNATAIGYNAQVTASNSLVLGNTVNVGIGTSSPLDLLHVNSAATPAYSQFRITSNNLGSLAATNYSADNSAISFDVDNSAGAWVARNASVAWLYKSGGSLHIDGSGANTVGGTAIENQFFAVNLSNGNIGISTTDNSNWQLATSPYKLNVGGSAIATAVYVKSVSSWPDYVFKKEYSLPTLNELKTYIDQNYHLPEVPSAQEVEKDGLNLGDMNKILLKKVEELTLYLIEMKKELEAQQKEISALKANK